MEDTIKQLRHHGYKVTEEYDRPGHLSKVSGEHPPKKTSWDWLQLFIIPLVLLLIGAWFSYLQNQQQLAQQSVSAQMQATQVALTQAQALDQQRAVILQTYIDNIQDLLLNHHLLESKPTDDVAILARARTLTALQGLDSERKGLLVQFIWEARLIGFWGDMPQPHEPIINLSRANLSGAKLPNASLSGAALSYTYLADADLSGANLPEADFVAATLTKVNFNNAYLMLAHLSSANLTNATLYGADLTEADLSVATLTNANLTNATLFGADLSNATLKSTTLTNASLNGANLSYANLTNANLTNVTFGPIDITFEHTNVSLRGTNLRGAILRGANLHGANLTQQQLDQVKSCFDAILPPGLTCHQNH